MSKIRPRKVLLVAVLAGCASAHSKPTAAPVSPSSNDVASACAGFSEDEMGSSLCLETDAIVRLERVPVQKSGGDVLTGARMIFRPAPGQTPESFQRLIDCQAARRSNGELGEAKARTAPCPLAISGVTTKVLPVADGLAVEVRPKDAATSRRLSHTLAHGLMAQEFGRFESSECRGIAPKIRAACPLLGPVTAISDMPAGVRVEFPPSASIKDVLAGMRCHYSFARARGFSVEATACPMYMPGLHLERAADGSAIEITVSPIGMVDDLRKGVREEAVFAANARPDGH